MKKPQNTLLDQPGITALGDLGQRIQRLRLARRIPQAEASVRAGIARSTASRIENGDPAVAIGQVVRYLQAIAPEKSLETLFTQNDLPETLLAASERRQRARPLSKAALEALDF